jgi:hypothetical protein
MAASLAQAASVRAQTRAGSIVLLVSWQTLTAPCLPA